MKSLRVVEFNGGNITVYSTKFTVSTAFKDYYDKSTLLNFMLNTIITVVFRLL